MATIRSASTVSVTARELLLRASALLDQVHGLLRDAAAMQAPEVQIANLAEATADLRDECSTDASKLGEQHDSHVTLRAEHVKQQPAPAILAPCAAQVTTESTPVQADQHVVDYKAALLADCKLFGIRASKTWKISTLQAKLDAAVKPEPVAEAPQHVVAATTAKTVTVDVPCDRADAIRRLAQLSDADFLALAALIPATKAA